MLTDTSVSNISKYPDRDKSHQILTYRHCYSTQMLLYILITKMEIKLLESKKFFILQVLMRLVGVLLSFRTKQNPSFRVKFVDTCPKINPIAGGT